MSDNLASGKTVGGGRYILNRQIGEHSNTWLAQDDIENKLVVLTFLPMELCQDPRALEELRGQITIVRDLSHTNVGSIYELYEAEGEESFISSEYIEGMNLHALQQLQPSRVFNWTFLAPLLKQICDALQFVHSNGLVQGSLKPSNLMLDRKGQIKLLDLGIAGVLNNPLYAGPPQAAGNGLLPYLSPQQIDGAPPQITDDVYSLGVTIYEFLTGTVPFNTGDILPQIRNSQPQAIEQRLAQLRISNPVPPIISSMVTACLTKDPSGRPQDVDTLSKSLDIAELPQPEAPKQFPVQRAENRAAVEVLPPDRNLTPARPAQTPAQAGKSPALVIAVVVLALLLAGAGAVIFLKRQKTPQTAEAPSVAPVSQEVINQVNNSEREALNAIKADPGNGTKPAHASTTAVSVDAETKEEMQLKRAALEGKELYQLASKSDSSLLSLFNGEENLAAAGWNGDPDYWSVEQGLITGRTPANAPANVNTCLTWVGAGGNEKVTDFELRFQFRFKMVKANNQALAGVVYRGRKTQGWDVWGYESRLSLGGENIGMLTSRDRNGMISYTQRIIISESSGLDKAQFAGDLEPETIIKASLKKEDWNECVITAQGNHFTHKINGHIVADLVDQNAKRRADSGLLALELNTGVQRAVFVQFRNLKLKRLSK